MGDPSSVVSLVVVILRNRYAVVAFTFGVALLVVFTTLFAPRTYTATVSFTPQAGSEEMRSRLAGLAGQLGINIPAGEIGESPQFYVHLVRSRELLKAVVTTEYEATSDGVEGQRNALTGDLVRLLEIERDRRAEAVEVAVERLRTDLLSVSVDTETGVVRFSVTTYWPSLSRAIAERVLALVSRFNLERRQTQGAAERRFIEQQLAQAEAKLLAAEDSLQAFFQRNRRYENDPELTFQKERLERRVNLRQQVYTTLSQAYEDAKIQEVRDTPVITVIDPPGLPARPDPRRLILKGILGLLVGGTLGAMWAFGRGLAVATRRSEPESYAEFARLKTETAEELRRVVRQLKQLVTRP